MTTETQTREQIAAALQKMAEEGARHQQERQEREHQADLDRQAEVIAREAEKELKRAEARAKFAEEIASRPKSTPTERTTSIMRRL